MLVVLSVAASGYAGEITGGATLDVASAYVFRGATFNDGLVVQPGVEASTAGFALGAWANYDIDDYSGALEKNEFSEVDIYGSYAIPVDVVDLSVGYCAYIYPLDSTDADHEVSVSVGLDLPLAPSLSVYYGLGGGIEDTLYCEFGIGQEFELSEAVGLELGAALGYVDPDDGESGFSHANLSATLSYSIFSASITYVAQLDDDVLMDVADGGAYDTEVYGMVGAGLSF